MFSDMQIPPAVHDCPTISSLCNGNCACSNGRAGRSAMPSMTWRFPHMGLPNHMCAAGCVHPCHQATTCMVPTCQDRSRFTPSHLPEQSVLCWLYVSLDMLAVYNESTNPLAQRAGRRTLSCKWRDPGRAKNAACMLAAHHEAVSRPQGWSVQHAAK